MAHDTDGTILFPTDDPVPDSMIGRATDVERLSSFLAEGVNQLVAGPRREGKTTVCRAATARLRSRGIYVVEADLFAVPGLVRLADALVGELVANRPQLHRIGHGPSQGTRATAAGVSEAFSVRVRSKLGDDVELVFQPLRIRQADPFVYFQQAVRLLERIGAHDDVRVVLYLDEFQEIGWPHSPFGNSDTVMGLLRGELQSSPHVTTLFAGSVAHLMRDLFGTEHRAFFKWGSWFDLSPISTVTWSVGISERGAAAGVGFDERSLSHLISLGELHPRPIMLIAQQAYVAAKVAGLSRIGLDLVEDAFDLAVRADAMAHEIMVRQARHIGRYGLDVLLRIASGEPPYGTKHASDAKRAIDALAADGLIERTTTEYRGGWVVTDPLFRRYLVELEV